MAAAEAALQAVPPPVRCECGFLIWDGVALRARVVLPARGIAKCRCKRWVSVPIGLVS